MTFFETLKSQWRESINYLSAQDVPTFTQSIADGVRRVLTTLLQTLQKAVSTCPPRLVICLMLIAVCVLGLWIISMF